MEYMSEYIAWTNLRCQFEAELGEECGQQQGKGHFGQILAHAVAGALPKRKVSPGLGRQRCITPAN